MKALLAAITIVVGLVAARPAEAKVYKLKSIDVSLDVPKGWKVDATDSQINAATKDETLAISVTHVPSGDIDGMWTETVNALGGMLDGAQIGDRKDGVLGGMSGYVTTASGSLAGAPVSALATLLRAPSGELVLVIAIGQVGKYEKHEKAMFKVLNSLDAKVPLFNDEGYFALPDDAKKIADKVATLVQKNDAKGFLAMVDKKKGFTFAGADYGGERYDKAALKKMIKSGGSVATGVQLPETGAWHVEYGSDPKRFELWRGDWEPAKQHLVVEKVGKKWFVTGSLEWFAEEGADDM